MEVTNFYNYGVMNEVEAGATQINNFYGKHAEGALTQTEQDIHEALEGLMDARDEAGEVVMHDLDQWYAVFRVLSQFCGFPTKPKEFEQSMHNMGADELRVPCKYESFRKVTLHKLPQNVALWRQYLNSADQYTKKQLVVALKLMELLHLE